MVPLLVALDSPESVTYVGAPQIEAAGGEDIVWDAALKNLVAEGPGEPDEMRFEDGSFLVFETESVYQASWLAYPDRLVELLGYKPGPLGALLSIPATKHPVPAPCHRGHNHHGHLRDDRGHRGHAIPAPLCAQPAAVLVGRHDRAAHHRPRR
jgi:hypothetical protein